MLTGESRRHTAFSDHVSLKILQDDGQSEEVCGQPRRKPKPDKMRHRYVFRLDDGDNARFLALFDESGKATKAEFIVSALFGKEIKVIKLDKGTQDFYMRLTTFHSQFRAIGTNYQPMRACAQIQFLGEESPRFPLQAGAAHPRTGRVKQADFRTGGGVPEQIPRPMIAKISHGSSLYGVLAYNQLKVDERHADVLFTSRIIEPQGDNPYTIGHLSRSFGDYLTANRKTEKPVLHISLNPDPKDCLS